MRKGSWVAVVAMSAGLGACETAVEGQDAASLQFDCSDTTSALRVCANGTTIKGIDVSYWQGAVDWSRVGNSGVKFGFARISDGVRHPDTQFERNWRQMKAQGVTRGAYQFFRSNADPIAQARLVVQKLEAAGGMEDGDLPVVLDLESTDGMSANTVIARARQWLEYVEQHTGKRPLVYTAAFMSNVINGRLSDYPLWVANYGATCPSMPSGWGRWKFWQYSDRGAVAGVSGNTDMNYFNGGVADLQAFALNQNVGAAQPGGGGEVPPPATEPQRCSELKVVDLSGGNLNIRPTAGTSRAPVGTIREGQVASILDRAQGEQIGNTKLWLKIRSPAGVTGWVTARYVRCNGAGALSEGDIEWEDLGFDNGRVLGDTEAWSGEESSEVVPALCAQFQ